MTEQEVRAAVVTGRMYGLPKGTMLCPKCWKNPVETPIIATSLHIHFDGEDGTYTTEEYEPGICKMCEWNREYAKWKTDHSNETR